MKRLTRRTKPVDTLHESHTVKSTVNPAPGIGKHQNVNKKSRTADALPRPKVEVEEEKTTKPARKTRPIRGNNVNKTPPGSPQIVSNNLNEAKSPGLGMTPTQIRIKEIFGDDFLCSQNATESMCDVRWDCTSPDAVREAMKRPTKKNEAVTELAQRLKDCHDEVNYEETDSKNRSLLGLWQPNGFDSQQKRSFRKRKSGKRKPPKHNLIPDITEKYNEWLQSLQSETLQKEVTVSEVCELDKEVETIPDICVPQISDNSKRTSSDEQGNNLFSDEEALLPTGVIKYTKTSSSGTTEDSWSDDDLFNEDSFLMHATQMTENRLEEICKGNKRKRESLGATAKPAKDSKIIPNEAEPKAVTASSDSNNNNSTRSVVATQVRNLIISANQNSKTTVNQIKSSAYPKTSGSNVFSHQNIIPASSSSVSTAPMLNIHSKQSNQYSASSNLTPKDKKNHLNCEDSGNNSFLSRNSFYSMKKSNFRKHNSFSGSPNYSVSNVSPILNNANESTKSPFRKHKSFDVSQHLTSTPTGKTGSWQSTCQSDSKPPLADTNSSFKPNKNLNSIVTRKLVHVMPKIEESKDVSRIQASKGLSRFQESKDLSRLQESKGLSRLQESNTLSRLQEPKIQEPDSLSRLQIPNIQESKGLSRIQESKSLSKVENSKGKSQAKPIEQLKQPHDSFLDDSISDDILQELAESDEALESQATPEAIVSPPDLPTSRTNPTELGLDEALLEMFDDDFSLTDIDLDMENGKKRTDGVLQKAPQNYSVIEIHKNSNAIKNNVSKFVSALPNSDLKCNNNLQTVLNSNQPLQTYNHKGIGVAADSVSVTQTTVIRQSKNMPVCKPIQQNHIININNKCVSYPTRNGGSNIVPSQSKFSFKKRSQNSTIQPSRSTVHQQTSSAEPPLNIVNRNVCPAKPVEFAMTQELFNDDSFTCDDSLIESQFLAELEKVESSLTIPQKMKPRL